MAREEGGARDTGKSGRADHRGHAVIITACTFPEGREKWFKGFMKNERGLHFEKLFLPPLLTRWKEIRNRSREASLRDAAAVYSPGKREWGQIQTDSEYEVWRAIRPGRGTFKTHWWIQMAFHVGVSAHGKDRVNRDYHVCSQASLLFFGWELWKGRKYLIGKSGKLMEQGMDKNQENLSYHWSFEIAMVHNWQEAIDVDETEALQNISMNLGVTRIYI